MKRRVHAICTTAITVLALAGPTAPAAYARGDLDCRDFTFQEDAQAEFDRGFSDPDRSGRDQGRNNGIACAHLPHRGSIVTPLPTLAPLPTRSAVPTQGVRGGLGGSSGPADVEVALGAGLAVGALALTAGFFVYRRRLNR
ncbi:hypothetical protein [Streptomyces lanatus]|uniref:Excalibur calcium-binding protein n=1 Tax=Streptomyces lanatus TaxID=66900 RepID=A0ABV1Y3E7_9ACTN|nr:hypothetical protein [Streptomyces lanatus]GHH14207.1 calcium-binding protein [Streptomyces lanatus]